MTKCPVCRAPFSASAYLDLAEHLTTSAFRSDAAHIRWLNQSITKHRIGAGELRGRLVQLFEIPSGGLPRWVKERFIARFFGEPPHPFVAALQHPTRATLLGYAVEHQHFLRQWVRSCAYILARTSEIDVALYEIDNIRTEFGGDGPTRPSHYELLLRMGEGCGMPRGELLSIPALPTTRRTLAEWNSICSEEHWVEALVAMHSLELIAHRNLVKDGARVHYFAPEILTGTGIPEAAKDFLREGYEADIGHSDAALALVEKYAKSLGRVEEVQATFLRSMDLFDDYLGARLERAEQYGPTS
jgi:pyrroloquinoline-quinone synthase